VAYKARAGVQGMEWATSIFGSVERSRNVIVLSDVLDIEDLERLGINIGSRSWIGSSRSARSHSLGGVPQHLLWTGWPFPRKRC